MVRRLRAPDRGYDSQHGKHTIILRSLMSSRQISPRMSAAHHKYCDARPPNSWRVWNNPHAAPFESLVAHKRYRLSPLESNASVDLRSMQWLLPIRMTDSSGCVKNQSLS